MRHRLMTLALCVGLVAGLAAATHAQVKISYWAGWMNAHHQEAELAIIDEFMRQNPDIEVEFLHMSSPWDQLPIGHATGTIGDVLISSRDDFPNWQQMGIFKDLTPWLERDPEFVDAFVPQLMPLFQAPDGSQFGLPFSANGRGLTRYNKGLFDANGVAHPGLDPWSWDELVEHATKLVRYDETGAIVQEGIQIGTHPMTIWTWFWANDTDLWTADFSQTTVNTPKVAETLQFLQDLVHVHRVAAPPSAATTSAISLGHGPWSFQGWHTAHLEGTGPDYGIMWNPYNGDEKRVAMVGGSGLQIANRTRHPEEAWRLLKFLVSEEAQWIRFLEGYGTGSLKNHLVDAAAAEDSPIPQPRELYWQVFEYGLPQPTFPRYREWAAPFQQYLNQALEGEISVEEALVQIEHMTQVLLDN